ncbi:MAG TPA: hypothetical protein VNE62_03770 [Actinomycetota bacterium]|nr:hypothetical protein [Actinomycetota bacterium]
MWTVLDVVFDGLARLASVALVVSMGTLVVLTALPHVIPVFLQLCSLISSALVVAAGFLSDISTLYLSEVIARIGS